MLDAPLLLLEEGAAIEEGGQAVERHAGHRLAVVGLEDAKRVEDEPLIGDREADVTKRVGELLEAAAIRGDGEVTLIQVVELMEGVEGAASQTECVVSSGFMMIASISAEMVV